MLANLGSGAADLVLLPLRQYKKDGRVGVGLVRGASSFARKAVVETIGAASRVVGGAQVSARVLWICVVRARHDTGVFVFVFEPPTCASRSRCWRIWMTSCPRARSLSPWHHVGANGLATAATNATASLPARFPMCDGARKPTNPWASWMACTKRTTV